jgi:hypothetical protein
VLGRLEGRRYDGSPEARLLLVGELPMEALSPG